MSIAPIPPIEIAQIGLAGATPAAATTPGGGDTFAMITDALESVNSAHAKVDELSVAAATGDLNAVHELTMATAEAQLLTQLTVEVRNRAVESFNEIMRMQV